MGPHTYSEWCVCEQLACEQMTPLERLVQRATRLPLEMVQLIIDEARRSMAQLRLLRRSEAARTIQTASLRPIFLKSRAARTRVPGNPDGNQFMAWFRRVPRRYQDRYFEGREEFLEPGSYLRPFLN